MNVLERIEAALLNVGFKIGSGRYPEGENVCGKIVFDSLKEPINFFGNNPAAVETFAVVVKGDDYNLLVEKANVVKAALEKAGIIALTGLKDIEAPLGETYLQLSLSFKIFYQN